MEANVRRIRIELVELLYYISVALSVGLFLFLNVSLFVHRNLLTLVSITTLILMIPTLLLNIRNISRSAFFFGITFLSCVLYQIIRATNTYFYSSIEIFYAIRQYTWVLLFFVLIYLFANDEKKMKRILDNTLSILSVSLLLRFFSWFSFTFLKANLFPNILMEFGKLWYRNETSIRVDGTPLISIAMFLTFYLFLKYRDKKYLYTLMFMLLFAIFVNQTRMLIFPQIFSMILMYVYHKFPYMPLYLLFVIVGISCFFFFGGSEWFKNWIDAFNNGTSDMGLGYRYWELKYYLGLLTDYRWINGLGILTSSNPNSYFILFGPGRVQMYLVDLGFIELFVQFGLLAIFLYGYLLYMLTKLIRRMKTKQYIYERSLFIGLMANILITAPSLNIFGSQRSYSLVIILAMVFFYDYQLKRKDNKNG